MPNHRADIQYRDIAFLSTGDGLSVNFLRGHHYRVGAAIAYDYTRRSNRFRFQKIHA